MSLTRKSLLPILLGFFFPTADHVVIEAKVACHLCDAQPAFGYQADSFAFEFAAVLLTFGCFVLNSHCRSCGSVSLFHLSTFAGEFHFHRGASSASSSNG